MAQPIESGSPGVGNESASAGDGGGASAAASGVGVVTAAEIGRDWGTSRQYASKEIKKGCPTSSLEAARKWRAEHAVYGMGYRSKGKAPLRKDDAPAAEPNAPVEKQKAPAPPRERRELGQHDFSTLEGSLAAAIEVEEDAYAMVMEAQGDPKRASEVSVRIQNYNKARDGRMEAQKRVQELREAEEKVVPVDAAKELIRKVIVPLITRLRALPQRAGFKANPADALHAEGMISEELEAVIGEVRLEVA